MSLTLSPPDPTDASRGVSWREIAEAAARVDGHRPFNEQAVLDVAAGRRAALLLRAGGTTVGAALIGDGRLDLVVAPEHRRRGHGGRALADLLSRDLGPLTAWSHGDHPAARSLADRHGFDAVRTLLQLRLQPLPGAHAELEELESPAAPIRVNAFRPDIDDDDWVELNALIFREHPEQGALTRDDLTARRGEPWFDAGDFLVARDGNGRMIGYNWLKIEDGQPVGEIYVVGVHPEAAGRGLGRRLMAAGLSRLRERGCSAADLYVEADNPAAVHLYRSVGFTNQVVDVQYRTRTGV